MRPVSLRFRCFGSYMAEQYIDFEELEQSGLFLICGETGSGKTTILDAICYALYGHSSGGLRGDMSVMRCKLAGKDDETYVEFTFDSGGKRYRFTRSLKYGRKNLNDSHNCMILRDGVFVPMFENPKMKSVNEAAQAIIGLTCDQFRQVILLPQGQFEKLLVSNSEEKEKILVSLFHADRWQKIVDEIGRRITVADKALRLEKQRIDDKLGEYGCATISALEELLAQKKVALTELAAQAEAAKTEVTLQRKAREAALLENRDFERLAQLEKQFGELERRAQWAQSEEVCLTLADKAETIAPLYRTYGEEKRLLDTARREVTAAGEKLEKAKSQWFRTRQEMKAHESTRPAQESRQKEILRLESCRPLYDTLEDKAKAEKDAKNAEKKAVQILAQAEKTYSEADARWHSAMADQDRAIVNYKQAQELYLRGIGHTLAQKLQPGLPCPVCGSTEHPAPARSDGGAQITEAQLEQLNSAMTQANQAVTQALHRRGAAESARNEAQTQASEATRKADLAHQDYAAALAQVIPGIQTSAQLDARLRELTKACANYEQTTQTLSAAATDAEVAGKAARAELERANAYLAERTTSFTQCKAQWEQALVDAGLETETRYAAAVIPAGQRQQRWSALHAYYAQLSSLQGSLAEQRLVLEGKTAPDLAGISQALANAEKAQQTHSAALVLTRNQVSAMEEDLAQLSRRLAQHDADRVRTDGNLEFAGRLRGSSGISLQRYVLGVMLTSITTQANLLLKNVYGGRYQLYRTDEIAGSSRKGGLELEVYDNSNAQRRSVTTLSGGEKFLVSLSLAIGLSTVVQAQGGGLRLEAMFIDEGFGSLDADSISDALGVLQNIGKNCGVVGIISHVGQLAESIPTKIQVTKGTKGSMCKICR